MKDIEIRHSLEMALNIHEKGLTIPKPYKFVKSEKYEEFCVSEILVWRQKRVAGVLHGNSLVVRLVSPGKKTAVLFWTKARQIKPRILELTITRGQSNLSIVFILLHAKKTAIIVSFQ